MVILVRHPEKGVEGGYKMLGKGMVPHGFSRGGDSDVVDVLMYKSKSLFSILCNFF